MAYREVLAVDVAQDHIYHIFIHHKKTAWVAFCKELASCGASGPTYDSARRGVYENIRRETGLIEVSVVEEIVQRGKVDLASGSINHAIH